VTLHRVAVAVLLALTVASGAGACTTVAPPIAPPLTERPTSDPDSLQALSRALATLSTESYRVRVVASHGRVVAMGTVAPSTASFDVQCATAVEDDAFRESIRKVGGGVWLNVAFPDVNAELGISAEQWIAVSAAKLAVGGGAKFDVASRDPLDLGVLFDGVTVVRRSDPTHLAGTVDFTHSHGVTAPDADELSEAGKAASATPFTATLDGDGRLLTVTIDADAYNPDLTRTVTLSGYGSVPAPAPPAKSSVVAATPAVYQLFNEG
jgi:hypothetical protein